MSALAQKETWMQKVPKIATFALLEKQNHQASNLNWSSEQFLFQYKLNYLQEIHPSFFCEVLF
jgi:hypothetical protein